MKFKICFLTILLSAFAITNLTCKKHDDFIDKNPFNNLDGNGNEVLSKTSEFIIIIPDLQIYTYYDEYHKFLETIIDRIIEIHTKNFNIKAVLQVGDITEKNSEREWEAAKRIFAKLDNIVDYMFCTGNHDYGDNGTCNNRISLFNEYFNYSSNSSFVSSFIMNDFENAYFHINIHNQPFQIFSLEFGPRDSIIDWAKHIVNEYNDRIGIILTHAYLHQDNERFDWQKLSFSQKGSPYEYALSPEFGREKVNDGQEIWDKLVLNNNIQFVFCGHKATPDYIGKLISKNNLGHDVLQMLYNTQAFPNGGDGWIQILEFYDDQKTVGVKTYSTLLNIWETIPTHQYEFVYK